MTSIVPATLAGWTLQKIEETARASITENDLFDLKADLQTAEHERKTVAAFANSAGGFLVFGVTNDRRIEGVSNTELVRDFGIHLRDKMSPSVEFRFADRPHPLPNGRLVYVAHVPRSARAPHAVYVNGAWAFLKRSPAGSNDPMTYEEIHAAFTDANRRLRELAWLKAEVGRLRVLAENMHPNAPASEARPLSRITTRFDIGQLRAIRLSLFDDLSRQPVLISALDELEAHCTNINEALAPLTVFALVPRDRSFSGSRHDGRAFAVSEAEQITINARSILALLETLPT